MIKEILDLPYSPHEPSGKFPISSISQCPRKVFKTLKGLYKEEFDEGLLRTFRIGNVVHQEVIRELISKGNVNNIHITAAEISLASPHPLISGRIDVLVSDGKELYVCDVKSASKWTIDKIKKGDVPQNYIDQVLLYLHFTGLKSGILLFVGKDKGNIVEVPVPADEPRANQLIKQIEDFFKNYVIPNIEPPKCDGKPFGCNCCYPKESNKKVPTETGAT